MNKMWNSKFTMIPNKILRVLIERRLTTLQISVLLLILRYSVGFNDETASSPYKVKTTCTFTMDQITQHLKDQKQSRLRDAVEQLTQPPFEFFTRAKKQGTTEWRLNKKFIDCFLKSNSDKKSS